MKTLQFGESVYQGVSAANDKIVGQDEQDEDGEG